MGIYDRDYYRKGSGRGGAIGLWLQTAVGFLITVNVVCWILQVGSETATGWLSASADQVSGRGAPGKSVPTKQDLRGSIRLENNFRGL